MTRATLLHILDHPAAISPEEVRELEQLAQAFPYCQTAHVLLAKAAHDHGTMLAGQRLRRAATYAADRELLRRLIEQVPEAPEPVIAVPEAVAAADTSAVPQVAPVPMPEPAVEAQPEPVAPVVAPVAVAPVMPEAVAAPELPIIPEPEAAALPEVPAPMATPAPEPVAEEVAPAPLEVASVTPAMAEEPPILAAVEVVTSSEEVAPGEADAPAVAEVDEALEIPAVAPPIRPPAEQGAARFEFGLSDPDPLPVVPYVLPGLEEEVNLSLPELIPTVMRPAAPARSEPLVTPLAFTGDEAVGYGLAMGSRGGFALEPLMELMAAAEASWGVAATPLPHPDAFFEPDVLLTAYWAANRPAIEPAPSSLDLINNFLRRQPRLTRPAAPTPMTEAQVQADLSVRSTGPKPDLASESLARILARQGKNERAIEIYQRLMLKQPEKTAYFQAQIQQLQLPNRTSR